MMPKFRETIPLRLLRKKVFISMNEPPSLPLHMGTMEYYNLADILFSRLEKQSNLLGIRCLNTRVCLEPETW
jgi:hypothetical protein